MVILLSRYSQVRVWSSELALWGTRDQVKKAIPYNKRNMIFKIFALRSVGSCFLHTYWVDTFEGKSRRRREKILHFFRREAAKFLQLELKPRFDP